MVQALTMHSSIQRILPQGLRVINRPRLFLRLKEIILFTDSLLTQLLNDLVPILIPNQPTLLLLLDSYLLLIIRWHFFLFL